jgi:centromere protein I
MGLLAYIPIERFQDEYTLLFQPAEQAMAKGGQIGYEGIIKFYTSLLQQQVCIASSQTDRNTPFNSKVFQDIAAHVSTLSMSLLLSLPAEQGQSLKSTILSFYEILSVCSKPHVVPIILPPMRLVYLLVQQASTSTLSRTCGIVSAYKQAFDTHPKPVKDYHPTQVTDALNWCLRDIYHLLWITRALTVVENKTMGLHCDPELRSALNDYLSNVDREYVIGAAFGLPHNAWLASLGASAWRAMEEREINREGFDKSSIRYHQGPVSQRSLEVLKRKGGVDVDWDGAQGYKVFAMNWLGDRGLDGIRDLMFATVSELRGKV